MNSFDTVETRVLSKGELGHVVRYLRELRQWSQETLAELAKTTPRTIQRVEAGAGSSGNTLRSLASAFEFQDIDAFLKPMAIPTEEQLRAARKQFSAGTSMRRGFSYSTPVSPVEGAHSRAVREPEDSREPNGSNHIMLVLPLPCQFDISGTRAVLHLLGPCSERWR